MSGQTIREKSRQNNPTPEVDITSLLPKEPLVEDPLAPNGNVELTERDQFLLAAFKVTEKELSPNVKTIITRLDQYEERMNPKVSINTDREGAENQLFFINTILRATNYQGDELLQAINIILWTMNKGRKTTYADKMIFRFIPFIRRSAEDVNAYARIIEIFVQLSNPITRAEIAKSQMMANAIRYMPPSYKQVAFSMSVYLSSY